MAKRLWHSAREEQKHRQLRRGAESWLRLEAPGGASLAHLQRRHKKQPWSQRWWSPGWGSAGSQATSYGCKRSRWIQAAAAMWRKVMGGRRWQLGRQEWPTKGKGFIASWEAKEKKRDSRRRCCLTLSYLVCFFSRKARQQCRRELWEVEGGRWLGRRGRSRASDRSVVPKTSTKRPMRNGT